MAVIDILDRLDAHQRAASPDEQEILASWSGWGAVPDVFDRRTEAFAVEREHLRGQLSPEQYRAAEASILNAHYTDPAIAHAMWDAVRAAGFAGGRVLEPGCGSGTFIGLAPDNAVMVGVENDPITARVAAALYPSAQIRSEGFETTRVPGDSFAAVLGNVPFGQFTVYDPAHNPDRFSIHNHFIIKSLDLTAPGGYAVVLSSRYTLDNLDTRARRAIAARADLLGAVRLPTKAFARVAGTDVVTDILVLRRRDPDREHTEPGWIDTHTLHLPDPANADGVDIPINTYFRDHPQRVLGTFRAGHGIHGSTTLHVDGPTGEQLISHISAQLRDIIGAARQRGHGLTATPDTLTELDEATFDAGLITPADQGPQIPLDTLRYDPDTQTIQRWTGHGWAAQRTPKSLIAETRKLIDLRDAATAVIAAQRDHQPAATREQLRGHLNRLYDRYVQKHGPINRFRWVHPNPITQQRHDKKVAAAEERWRTSQAVDGQPYRGPVPDELAQRWDEAAWSAPEPYKRRPHLDGGIKNDPGWAIVAALEIFDEDTGTARKAPIFAVDLLAARSVPEHADTIHDALAISFDQRHRVDVDHIAALLGCTAEQARAQLHGLVYPSLEDPDELVPAVTALSGNVRTKLARAKAAARTTPAYTDYVAALRAVMPPDKQAAQIKVRPGAPWIDADIVAQFARETLGAGDVTVDHLNGTWSIQCPKWQRHTVAMTETCGTAHMDAISVLDAVCNSKAIVINRSNEDIECRTAAPESTSRPPSPRKPKPPRSPTSSRSWIFADDARRDQLGRRIQPAVQQPARTTHRGDRPAACPACPTTSTPPLPARRRRPHRRRTHRAARPRRRRRQDRHHGDGRDGTPPPRPGPPTLDRRPQPPRRTSRPRSQTVVSGRADPARRRRHRPPKVAARLRAQSAATDWDMVIVPQSLFTAIGVSADTQAATSKTRLDEMRHQPNIAQNRRQQETRSSSPKRRPDARLEELTEQAPAKTPG